MKEFRNHIRARILAKYQLIVGNDLSLLYICIECQVHISTFTGFRNRTTNTRKIYCPFYDTNTCYQKTSQGKTELTMVRRL